MEYSQQVSVNTLQRLPTYLNYLKSLDDDGNISSTEIARALGLNDVQVRKDLSSVSSTYVLPRLPRVRSAHRCRI